MPEGEEWSITEVLIDILMPFEQATEATSAVKYPKLSTVKPLLYKLVNGTLEESQREYLRGCKENEAINQEGLKGMLQYPICGKDLQHRYIL